MISLVGGTALSLQIGHRISLDIDLFSLGGFDKNKLVNGLEFLTAKLETVIFQLPTDL
jgi:hypothetical protein